MSTDFGTLIWKIREGCRGLYFSTKALKRKLSLDCRLVPEVMLDYQCLVQLEGVDVAVKQAKATSAADLCLKKSRRPAKTCDGGDRRKGCSIWLIQQQPQHEPQHLRPSRTSNRRHQGGGPTTDLTIQIRR